MNATKAALLGAAPDDSMARTVSATPARGAVRAARRLSARTPTPGLDAAVALADGGWWHLKHAVAHFTLAGRTTCREAARWWVADEMRRLAGAIEAGELDADALADNMLADAADHESRRFKPPWWMPPLSDEDAPPDGEGRPVIGTLP